MDTASIASAFVAASAGQFQMAVADKILATSLDEGRSALKLIDAAQQNISSLANVPAGVGSNIDITV